MGRPDDDVQRLRVRGDDGGQRIDRELVALARASRPKLRITSRPSTPRPGLTVAGSTSGRSGTPCGMTSTRRDRRRRRSSAGRPPTRDITTVAATRSTSSVRIGALARRSGPRRTVWSVATAGTSSARTKSRTYAPSSPPQIPYSCWIETTSTQRSSVAGGAHVVGGSSRRMRWWTSIGYGSRGSGRMQGDDLAAADRRGQVVGEGRDPAAARRVGGDEGGPNDGGAPLGERQPRRRDPRGERARGVR